MGYREAQSLATHFGIDLATPWRDLPEQFRHGLLFGFGDEKIRFTYQGEWSEGTYSGESHRFFKGIVHHINRLYHQTSSEQTRRWYASFMSEQICAACQGSRLCSQARGVTIGAKTITEVTALSIGEAYAWTVALASGDEDAPAGTAVLGSEELEIAGEVLKEIRERLRFMLNVGLHYLTLDRPAPSLSGGEGQRIRLASQLGCGLVGVLYILDEPSIGLHARDNRALIDTLLRLRDMGNTVLVVEHDADMMRSADWLIDLGPGAGVLGGEVMASATPADVARDPHSLTGRYLSGELSVAPRGADARRQPDGRWLRVVGARMHNLKNVTASIPLGLMTCVTGVSGSGKSSLISQTLYPALARAYHHAEATPGPHQAIEGIDYCDNIINITQDPIGRTPRSNPATYVKLFDEIRQLFASTPEARARGYKPDRFSFNVKGGRCESCQGHGQKRIEMHFLADVWITCKECNGSRFNKETLAVTYKGKTIADVLNLDVREALTFFANVPRMERMLQTLYDVGLDYIKLGQSATTLSGGEAQRIKLAKELSHPATGRTIYILDEPTTGLHFADIDRLLDVLHRLVDAGNTVIVVEHNLDVIRSADWLLDLGPEGGQKGGYLIAEGSPEDVAEIAESATGQCLAAHFTDSVLVSAAS
jgi:excinuclease ABC subunit A